MILKMIFGDYWFELTCTDAKLCPCARHYPPIVLIHTKEVWLCSNMNEKLFTGM